MTENVAEIIDAAGAATALKAARRHVRVCESEVKRANVALHAVLCRRNMVSAMDRHDIPDDHRPRLVQEMSALGKGADFDAHVRDYKTAFITEAR